MITYHFRINHFGGSNDVEIKARGIVVAWEEAMAFARGAKLVPTMTGIELLASAPCPKGLKAGEHDQSATWWCRMCGQKGLTKAQRDEHEKQKHPGEKFRRDLDDAHPSERR